MSDGDCHSVYSEPEETTPFPWTRDLANGGYDNDCARERSTVWPAECSVLRYGAGFPIEQTSSRLAGGIGRKRAVGRVEVIVSISLLGICRLGCLRRDFLEPLWSALVFISGSSSREG
jgi:hypothetical protein